MITLQGVRTAFLKARIAYHRRQSNACNKPVARSFKRDNYGIWLRNMAMRHATKARDLERKLLLISG